MSYDTFRECFGGRFDQYEKLNDAPTELQRVVHLVRNEQAVPADLVQYTESDQLWADVKVDEETFFQALAMPNKDGFIRWYLATHIFSRETAMRAMTVALLNEKYGWVKALTRCNPPPDYMVQLLMVVTENKNYDLLKGLLEHRVVWLTPMVQKYCLECDDEQVSALGQH